MNRRTFLSAAAAPALGAARLGLAAPPSRSYGAGLLAHIGGKLNALAARWDEERSRIRTAEDVEKRNRFVREKVREMIHGFPEKNPLEAVTVKTNHRDGYRIESVMFQSRPNFWVTGSLYVPSSGNGPFPGIISPCGHSAPGRLQPNYQFAYIDMVKSGFVVLAYDPVGQGERRHYWDPRTGQTESGLGPTDEHSMPGQLLLLLGEDLTHYRVWDGIRAIDYLLSRPEVDPNRIGCGGHSGGGTLTMFISAVDERVRCAVISEGGTSHRWPVRVGPGGRIGPADVEQNLFPAAIHGVDLCDLHVAIAPRPLLVLIEAYSKGFDETAAHIRRRYEQCGVPEKFATEQATDPHGWTVKLRLATADWFCRWFSGTRGPTREPDYEPEAPQTLWCTPNGSIRYSGRGDTIFSLIAKKQAALPPARPQLRSAAEVAAFRREIEPQIRTLLRYPKANGPLEPRTLVTTPRKGYSVEKLEFLSEPGISIPTWVFLPERRRAGPAILFVDEAGKQAEGMEFGLLEKLARRGILSAAVDVRGAGGTSLSGGSSSAAPFGHLFNTETALSYMAWFADESLFGMRVFDVVRSVDYLLARADADRAGVRAIGRGMGALWVLYAAALDPRIQAAVCEGGLLSYRSLTASDRYLHGADVFIPGVLKHFDLPHVAAATAGRSLALVAPLDAMKNPVDAAAARDAYRWTAQAFAAAGAPGRFRISNQAPEADLADQYLDLLGLAAGRDRRS